MILDTLWKKLCFKKAVWFFHPPRSPPPLVWQKTTLFHVFFLNPSLSFVSFFWVLPLGYQSFSPIWTDFTWLTFIQSLGIASSDAFRKSLNRVIKCVIKKAWQYKSVYTWSKEIWLYNFHTACEEAVYQIGGAKEQINQFAQTGQSVWRATLKKQPNRPIEKMAIAHLCNIAF